MKGSADQTCLLKTNRICYIIIVTIESLQAISNGCNKHIYFNVSRKLVDRELNGEDIVSKKMLMQNLTSAIVPRFSRCRVCYACRIENGFKVARDFSGPRYSPLSVLPLTSNYLQIDFTASEFVQFFDVAPEYFVLEITDKIHKRKIEET